MRGGRDEGSLTLAMLVTVVIVGLSALLVAVTTVALAGTRADVQTVRAVNAAHAGLNVGLARVMKLATVPMAENGCALQGRANDGSYQVSIKFYADDPGKGVCAFSAATHRYAEVVSVGSDGHGGITRTLTATYAFPVASVRRPPGGSLVFVDAGTCLTAGLTLATCVPGAATQNFVYGSDLTISRIDTATLRPTCVQADASVLSTQLCDARLATQRWYFNGRTFVTAAGNTCLDVVASTPAVGTGTRCTAAAGTTPVWRVDPQAGAGWAADVGSREIVSGVGFSRCLTTAVRLGVCAQDVNVPGVAGPWRFDAVPGTSFVTVATGTSCLSATPSGAVAMQTCSSGNVTQQWTAPRVGTTWGNSFRIQSSNGKCLNAAPSATDPYAGSISLAACGSAAAQKWNVDWTVFGPSRVKVGER